MDDLAEVQHIFISSKDKPRIDNNMPPIAGALMWCRSLLDRVQEPMEKLRNMAVCGGTGAASGGAPVAEREEAKEIEKMHHSLLHQLQAYENHKMEQWKSEIERTSQEKLQQPLLRRGDDARKLYVNFDPSLVRLLREVKYFILLNLPVPSGALSIFEQADTFRTQVPAAYRMLFVRHLALTLTVCSRLIRLAIWSSSSTCTTR